MADQASKIRAEIAEDREALAETVQELAAKADVKGHIKDKASETTEQLHREAKKMGHRVREITPDKARGGIGVAAEQVRRQPVPAVAFTALLVGLLLGKRLGNRKGKT